jgi:RimJ/RimL family protein N-acetyltransferase
MDLRPVVLEGRLVRLEALTLSHVDPLWEVASDPELWRHTLSKVASKDDLRRYVTEALEEQARGLALPFATLRRADGRPMGSTRFGNIAPAHRRVEIGWTWVGRGWQGTGANVEAKLLMLGYAFESWGVMRVELKTSRLNERSRGAMLALGATEEGILRRHMINDDGSARDTVFYSILDDEWPRVRARLGQRLADPR